MSAIAEFFLEVLGEAAGYIGGEIAFKDVQRKGAIIFLACCVIVMVILIIYYSV